MATTNNISILAIHYQVLFSILSIISILWGALPCFDQYFYDYQISNRRVKLILNKLTEEIVYDIEMELEK